jgi:hypothetical protein
VKPGVDSADLETIQVDILHVGRRGLQDQLELIVFVETIGVLPIAPIGGPAGRLDVDHSPGLGTENPKEGLWVHRSRAHLLIVGLVNHHSTLRPKAGKGEDELLKGHLFFSNRIKSSSI